MAVDRRDSATRAVGDTATASQAASIVTRAVGERGHGNLIKPREGAAAATQPPSPSEVHALGRLTEKEDGERRSSSELKDGGFPGSKKPTV
jgi:hypothetical protein